MSLFRNDNESEMEKEHRRLIEEFPAEEGSIQKTILRTGVFVAAALIAALILALAWFASNKNVSITGMHISADDGRTFYLATRKTDQQGIYDSNTEQSGSLVQALKKSERIEISGDNHDLSFQGLPQFAVGTNVVTAADNQEYIVGDADGISLMVNSISNVNNNMAEGYVGPGSRGEITFYMIPTVEGQNEVRITVSLEAYKLTATKNSADNRATVNAEVINDSRILNLLCGHMLLFRGKDQNGDYRDQIIPEKGSDGTISFPFTEAGETWEINQPVEITLYWIWPYRFENMVYSGQKESVFKTHGDGQTALISWINEHKEFVVYQTSPENAGTDMSNSLLTQWSTGHNRGDQLIGDTVAYFIWRISAEN